MFARLLAHKKFLIFLLLIVGAPLVTWIALQQQELRQRASESPNNPNVPTVTFSLESANGSPARVDVGQELHYDLYLDTNNTKVVGYDVTLAFGQNGPVKLRQFTPATPSGFDLVASTYTDATAANNAGEFRYGATSASNSLSGKVLLGNMAFTTDAATGGSLSLKNVQVIAEGYTGVSLNVQTDPGTYIVAVPTPTPQPPTPTTNPYPTNNTVSWRTPTVSLDADNFYIEADGKVFGKNMQNLQIHSDPGNPTYTTLELTWNEQNVEMRLFMYFSVEGSTWKVYEMRTYNGRNPGNWIYYDGTQSVPMGAFYSPSFEIIGKPNSDPAYNVPGKIHFGRLTIIPTFRSPSATAVPPTATPLPPTVTPTPVVGDMNGDTSVDILDYNFWRDEFTGTKTTKQADLNRDNKIDLLDFSIWRDAFVNPQPTLTQVTIAPTATPAPVVTKRVFITSTTYNGNLGGLAGADAKCQARASAVGAVGTYKAWLSDSTTNAVDRLTHNNGPYKLVNDVLVANNWAELANTTKLHPESILQNPINIDELGQLQDYAPVWIGPNGSCNNWTSSAGFGGGGGQIGSSHWTSEFWNKSGSTTCDYSATRLYCFQQ